MLIRQTKTVLLTTLLMVSLVVSGCKGKTTATTAGSAAPGTSSVTGASANGSTGTATSGGATGAAGTCPTSNTTGFAKSKFVLHVGLAAGTFHRYLYKPFKAGTFSKGAHGRVRALVKAGATALFDVHEVRLAIADVQASPALCKLLIAPLSAVADTFGQMKTKLTGGDTASITAANTALAGIETTSSQHGAPITESTDQSKG